MAKRFFDTNKFDDPFYESLTDKEKLGWELILCKCDNIGIFKFTSKLFSFYCGLSITDSAFESIYGKKLIKVGEWKYFIKNFLKIQYGESLKLKSPPHVGYLRRLKEEGFPVVAISEHEFSIPETIMAISKKYQTPDALVFVSLNDGGDCEILEENCVV